MHTTAQHSTTPNRTKLHSLRTIRPQHTQLTNHHTQLQLRKLELALEKDTQQEHTVAEPHSPLPDSEEGPPESRLWQYFLARMASVAQKVEKERVNCCEKWFHTIRKEVAARLDTHTRNADSLAAVVRQKYRQIHELFEEIRLLKAPSLFTDSPRNKRTRKSAQEGEPMGERREQIGQLRAEVEILEKDVEKKRAEHDKLEREWRTLLQNMLRQAYYLRDGVTQILAEMGRIRYTPQPNDFPPFLDQTSRACLLKEHAHLTSHPPTDQLRSRLSSSTHTGMSLGEVAKKVQLREVYTDTKKFISNWVRESAWKGSSLPPLRSPPPPPPDWREEERKRLPHAYEGDHMVRARQVLFGWKLESPA